MPSLPEPAQRAKVEHTDVALKNVRFSYTGEEKDEVLHGIDLTLPEGSFTALVGPSDGGKSTVATLIARFWDVSAGEITVGGVNVKDMPLSQLSESLRALSPSATARTHSASSMTRWTSSTRSEVSTSSTRTATM